MRYAIIVCLLAACRSSSSNSPDSSTDSPASGPVKIQDVQNDNMPVGTAVALKGVVVTAIDSFGAKTGDIWVQEPEGGPFSGVHVYKAPIAVVATLSVGDIVDLSGAIKAEFALTGTNADPTGRTVTELEPPVGGAMTLTKTGSGTPLTPTVVDALTIGQMTDADAQGPLFSAAWEQWEGVLITLDNISAQGAPKAFGSTMPTPADNYDFSTTGVIKVEGTLADITTAGVARGTCLASVTGVLDYFYDYLLLPRQTSEIVSGGTGCPAAESSTTACGDGIDNDANGFADCLDDGCMVGVTTCRMSSTINALDTATTAPTGGVEIGATESICVAAVTSDGQNMWVASGATAAANTGLYVYGGGAVLPTGVAVGTKLDVIGKAQAFMPTGATKPLLELDQLQITKQTGACTVAPAIGMTAATLDNTWVGSLVTLTQVKLTTVPNTNNKNIAQLTQGTTTFEAEADIHVLSSAVNTCFSSITGIWTWDPYANMYALEPLAEGTVGSGCP